MVFGLQSSSEVFLGVFWWSAVFFGFLVVVVVVVAEVFRVARIVIRGSQDRGLVGFRVVGSSPTVVGLESVKLRMAARYPAGF